MNTAQASTTLTASFGRAFVHVFLLILLVTAVGAVFEWVSSGHWWSADYVASLTIPLLLGPAFVCLMFVPKRIQWSGMEFQIQPRFGTTQTLAWTRLYAYGSGRGVFLLQFTGVSTFQIYAGAFPRDGWRAFRSFLTNSHPEKKTSFWLGPKAIRWHRKA